MVQVITPGNLGNEFDLGVIEANKIHVNFDGTSIVRNVGTGVVSAVTPATTNTLAAVAPNLTSTVNGVVATVDLTTLIQATETLTSISYNALTKTLTYTDEDGVVQNLDLSTLATDIFVTGGSYNAATGVLTLTDNDGGTADVTINLQDLKIVVTAASNSIAFTGTGEASSALVANLVVDPLVGNLLAVTAAGAAVDPAGVIAISVAAATVDVQDAFGVHQFYAFP